MAYIKRIQLPGVATPYDVYDNEARHEAISSSLTTTSTNSQIAGAKAVVDYVTNQISNLGSVLNFKGVKATESEVKAITSANVGDVWLVTANHSEWVCIKKITSADTSAWEEFGFDISGFASDTHTHTVSSSKTNVATVTASGSVTAGSAASFTEGAFTPNVPTVIDTSKFSGGSAATYTGHSFTANVPTKIDTTKFNGGTLPSFTQGAKASWSSSVSDDGVLSFSWTANGDDTFSAGATASLRAGFYTAGTAATHSTGIFNGGSAASLGTGFYTAGSAASKDADSFTANKPTAVTLPTFGNASVVSSVGASTSAPVES